MSTDDSTPKIELERVDLIGLGEALDSRDWHAGDLDPATGEVWPTFDGMESDDDEGGDAEEQELIPIRGEGSRGAYRDMEVFADYVGRRETRVRLEDALQGRGAFRRFRDVIESEPGDLADAWHRYRRLGAERRAVRWLDGENLVRTEAATSRVEAITAEMDQILSTLEAPRSSHVVDLSAELALVSEHWSPKVVARLNDYEIKLVKIKGEFVWHTHDDTDELFLVLEGNLTIQLRDADVTLTPGQLYVVPRGVEHCPVSDGEVAALLIEPAGVVNTGNAGGELTAAYDDSLLD